MMNHRAFTLVEIIVVSVIVGILAFLAVPNLTKMLNRSYAQDALHNLLAIYAAQKNYAQNEGVYIPCTDISDCNTVLGLNIIGNDTSYLCDDSSGDVVCSATRPSFIMKISIDYGVSSATSPKYCMADDPDNSHNPCCAGGDGTDKNCP